MPNRDNNGFLDDEANDPADPRPVSTFEAEQIDEYVRLSRHIYGFKNDANNQPYTDFLCFFRCLAGFQTKRSRVLNSEVETLFRQWKNFCVQKGLPVSDSISQFWGVQTTDLPNLEDCFSLNIHVYTLGFAERDFEEEGDIYDVLAQEAIDRDEGVEPVGEQDGYREISGQLFKRSMNIHPQHMYLNLSNAHFSLITDINKFAKFWRCEICDKVYRRRNQYIHHFRSCKGAVTYKYAGGGFGLRPTIIYKLRDEGYYIAAEDEVYPFVIVFDFEARFENADAPLPGAKMVREKKLIPVSVSVQSNIPGYVEHVCFVEEDPKVLIAKFYAYLCEISDKAYELMCVKFANIIALLDNGADSVARDRRTLQTLIGEGQAQAAEQLQGGIAETKHLEDLKIQLTRYLRQTPVLSFNGGKFDLNLIRKYFIPHIMQTDEIISPIMRGSQYLSMGTTKLLFLDVVNYVAAGTSYKKWLAGFQVEETKGVFCYEYLTSFDKLYETTLPPIGAFYSTLKGKGISLEEYEDLRNTWREKGFQNLKDLLVWYNSLDVGPFLKAIDKMSRMFQGMGIDMLKGGSISLPGVAMVKMFKDLPPDVVFQTFDEKNKDILEKIRSNIVGGLSQPFTRMAQVGIGSLKGGPPPQGIEGRDCNGLYPSTFEFDQATGIGRRFDPIDGVGESVATQPNVEDAAERDAKITANRAKKFKGEYTAMGLGELIGVNYMFARVQEQYPQETLTMKHKYNGGQKLIRVGKQRFPVDGWIPEKRIVLQYHGCKYHGHSCNITRNQDQTEFPRLAQKTEDIAQKIRNKGFTVFELRECEFKDLQRSDPAVKAYARSFMLPQFGRDGVKCSDIIAKIADGSFFGMVELDGQIPYWIPGLRESMTEFPPIFKNTEISIDDIGPTMAEFARENGLLKKPRRNLISSYFAEKQLMTTPMIKWLLAHEFRITRIHFAIQYVPRKVLAHLPLEVAHHRREADRNPDRKAFGELMKLLANSYFGKCLTDVTKFRNVHYLRRPDAARKIQSPLYCKLELIEEDIYEVQVAKAKVEFNLPITISFFVYAYAKQRMLEFYYDFLRRIMPETSFELLEMDTDSLYMALAKPTIEECVTPEYMAIYNAIKHKFLVQTEYDNRTPGLFKLEWCGHGMICLNPKTYIAFTVGPNGEIKDLKISSKGLSKQTNNLTVEQYKQVVETRRPVAGINRGFVSHEGHIWQYYQYRTGLTYLFIKRKVLPDGVHTVPLDL